MTSYDKKFQTLKNNTKMITKNSKSLTCAEAPPSSIMPVVFSGSPPKLPSA